MLEVAVALLIPHSVPVVVESLLRIVLIRLPLGALLPEATAAVGTLVAVAEARLEVVGSTVLHVVAIGLILEGVTYLMSNDTADGFAGRWCHPEGANHIIVTRTRCHPPFGCRVE